MVPMTVKRHRSNWWHIANHSTVSHTEDYVIDEFEPDGKPIPPPELGNTQADERAAKEAAPPSIRDLSPSGNTSL